MKKQLLTVLLIGGFISSSSHASDCPGNFLNGYFTPRGHPRFSWSIDTRTNEALIEKPGLGERFSGTGEMFCTEGKWSAKLSNMSHGISYNCDGAIRGINLVNATCTMGGGGKALVHDVTGTFSER